VLLACIGGGVLWLLVVWRPRRKTRPLDHRDLERLRRLCEQNRRESILPFE
jgi:hypothetical protein